MTRQKILSLVWACSSHFGAEKHFSSELLFCKRLQSLIYYRGKLLCFLLNTELQNLSSLKMCVHIAHQQEEAGRMCRYLSIPALGKVTPKGNTYQILLKHFSSLGIQLILPRVYAFLISILPKRNPSQQIMNCRSPQAHPVLRMQFHLLEDYQQDNKPSLYKENTFLHLLKDIYLIQIFSPNYPQFIKKKL